MKEIIDKHYKDLAQNYDKYLYYSPHFIRTLTVKMIEKLDLNENDIFVDLGGGTGMYSLDIHEQIRFKHYSYCVDAYKEMLNQIPDEAKRYIKPVCMDALTFSEQSYRYNKVLIKETVHHISERERLFANLYSRLPEGGGFLLVHVPPEIQYPIFEKALQRARGWHADPDELTLQLKNAGFRVERDFIDYPHKIQKQKYFEQVRSRFMSVLTSFSEDEIKEGLTEMEQKYKDQDILVFVDHFDYLTAIKD